jgi:hypothetical protein
MDENQKAKLSVITTYFDDADARVAFWMSLLIQATNPRQ